MGVGFKFIFDSFGLDNPLISAIIVLVNKFSGFIVVHGLNLSLCVLHVRTLNLETLDEHFFCFEKRKNYLIGKSAQKEKQKLLITFKRRRRRLLCAVSRSEAASIYRRTANVCYLTWHKTSGCESYNNC